MKEKLSGGKRTAEGMSSPEKPSAVRVAAIGKTGGAPARKVAHLTPEERAARGKAARNEVPRSSHGTWEPATKRPDPVGVARGAGRKPGAGAGARSVTAGCWCRRSRSTGGPR